MTGRNRALAAACWMSCLLGACREKHIRSDLTEAAAAPASAADERASVSPAVSSSSPELRSAGLGSSPVQASTPALAFDTDVLVFDVTWPNREWRTLTLQGQLAPQARLRVAQPLPHGLDLELEPGHDQSGRLRIQSCAAGPGTHVGNLLFETGLRDPARLALPYSCRVRGTLHVEPTNPYFNLRVSGPKRVRLLVRSTQPGFQVTAAEVARGPFAARILKRDVEDPAEPEDVVTIEVSVAEQKLSAATRGHSGLLRIHSTDRSEPIKEVPLFAFGKLNADAPKP